MPTLTVSRETLVYIIEKAREFDAEVPPILVDDASNPIDDEAGDWKTGPTIRPRRS
jgi:hypothetical protein